MNTELIENTIALIETFPDCFTYGESSPALELCTETNTLRFNVAGAFMLAYWNLEPRGQTALPAEYGQITSLAAAIRYVATIAGLDMRILGNLCKAEFLNYPMHRNATPYAKARTVTGSIRQTFCIPPRQKPCSVHNVGVSPALLRLLHPAT